MINVFIELDLNYLFKNTMQWQNPNLNHLNGIFTWDISIQDIWTRCKLMNL
jgi:hypothetical protein